MYIYPSIALPLKEALALLFSGIEPKPKRGDFCCKISGKQKWVCPKIGNFYHILV